MLERLREFLRHDRGSLEGVAAPTAVHLRARVATPSAIESPLTGLAAAYIHVDWRVERAADPGSREQRSNNTMFEHIGSGVLGGELLLDAPGGQVLLPASLFVVEFRGARGHGVALDRPLPPVFEHIAASPQARQGVLFYNELTLLAGEEVELIATVAPSPAGQGGGYRERGEPSDAAPFVACPELGPVLVRYTFPSM